MYVYIIYIHIYINTNVYLHLYIYTYIHKYTHIGIRLHGIKTAPYCFFINSKAKKLTKIH